MALLSLAALAAPAVSADLSSTPDRKLLLDGRNALDPARLQPVVQHLRAVPGRFNMPRWVPEIFRHARIRFIAVSNFIKSRWIEAGLPPDRVDVVYDQIEVNLQSSPECRVLPSPVVLYMGRLVDRKGPLLALRAFAGAGRPEWFMRIIGEGPQRAEIESLTHALDVSDRVSMCPPTSHPCEELSGEDIVLVPNFDEPLGLVTLEAQALGRAVITSRTGAAPELIRHMVDGVLVEGKGVGEWTNALVEVMDRPGLRMAIGNAAKQRAVWYTSGARHASEFASVLQRLAEKG
jgi:glycosyltransferase involved in cell wall biosynthesis